MKHLKRFNEELKNQTYRNAAKKLAELGHVKRSDNLKNYLSEIEVKKDFNKWKSNVSTFEKYDKVRILIKDPKSKNIIIDNYFYLDIFCDFTSFEDSYSEYKENNGGSFLFFIGLIPADEECYNLCKKTFKKHSLEDMNNGFIFGLSLDIYFDIIDHVVNINRLNLFDYDPSVSGHVNFADRAGVVKLKNRLKEMFSNPDLNYPSAYTDIEDFYHKFESSVLASAGFSSDYGFSMEDVANFIQGISINRIWKPFI